MQIPVIVAFEGMTESDSVQQEVFRRAAELEKFFQRITSCRVVIARPHHHGRQGDLFSARVDITVPGEEIIVNREHRFDHAHEDVYVAIRDSFRAARRQLEDYARRLRGEVKTRSAPATGRIARLFPAGGYGFIAALDGREVYLHQNVLTAGEFAGLRVGDELTFIEEQGEKGPQAASAKLTHPRRQAPSAAEV